MNEGTHFCSFCRKSQHEVRKLIYREAVMICDECITACLGLIVDDSSLCCTQKAELSKLLNETIRKCLAGRAGGCANSRVPASKPVSVSESLSHSAYEPKRARWNKNHPRGMQN